MDAQKKPLIYMMLTFLLLIVTNWFRGCVGKSYPENLIGNFLVYFTYILLLVFWCRSLNNRITQKNIRRMLMLSAGVMMFWMVIRFIQEAFLQQHIYLLRMSGYLIHVLLVLIPLLGFFASCSLGRGEEYRINRWWYWLAVPAFVLLIMVFMDPFSHFVYAVYQDEPQLNIYFHPNTGLLLIGAWIVSMEAARVFMIFKRNRRLEGKPFFHRLVPFIEIILLVMFTMPYFAQSFYIQEELIEFSVGIGFLEILSWEIYAFVGLIPVNTQYETVFLNSTLGMQILDKKGHLISKAKNSVKITPKMFRELKKSGMILESDGQEICMQPNSMGYTVWQRNVSDIHRIIQQLRQTESELKEESHLLSHELRAKSAKAAVQEKNRIYNQLTEEVSGQISALKDLLKNGMPCGENDEILRKICLIGTYIKQRCNLRLIEQAEEKILLQDLEHSFHDLIDSLEDYGIRTEIRWECNTISSPAFAMTVYDVFWYGLEYENFKVETIVSSFYATGCFAMELTYKEDTHPSLEMLKTHCHPSICMSGEPTKRGFRIRIWEGDKIE